MGNVSFCTIEFAGLTYIESHGIKWSLLTRTVHSSSLLMWFLAKTVYGEIISRTDCGRTSIVANRSRSYDTRESLNSAMLLYPTGFPLPV
nr:MAG: hypothetical protein [Apis mellifera filamentous virus]